MIATFAATTQLPLQQAIIIGAMLSLLLYCVQTTRGSELTGLSRDEKGTWTTTAVPATLPSNRVTVLDYTGSSFFAELPRLEAALPDPSGATTPVLVLVLRTTPDIPSSAMLKLFRRYANKLHEQGGQLILAGVRPAQAEAMEQTGITKLLGADNIVPATAELLGPLDTALRHGQDLIDRKAGSQHGG